MRKTFLIIILALPIHYVYCQTSNDLIIEHIARMSESNDDENTDYSEIIDEYWNIVEYPVNINGEEIDRLAEFKFIDVFQLENIKNYKRNYGDFQFIEELYEVDGMDEKTIEVIKPLICFEDKRNNDKISLNQILKYGKNKVLFEMNQCLNKKEGYKEIDDSVLYAKPNSIYFHTEIKLKQVWF